MAFEYPADLQYLDTHEYVRIEDDVATVGLSAFAIDQLGDIVFLELPAVDDEVEAGGTFGTIESVKAVEDLKSPVNGRVIDCNKTLVDAPEAIADDPYNDGWLIKVRLNDPDAELEETMTAAEYAAQVEGD
ncbi:MAG: glycine cleavage system protein GcvH [Cyanobacteria bacterium P01_G01_bin.54]